MKNFEVKILIKEFKHFVRSSMKHKFHAYLKMTPN